MKPHAAVDFETYYDKETLSVTTHGPWKYLHTTDIYLVSIVTDDGFEWVGDPKHAPWDRIPDHTWVSHNRSFDATAAKALGIDHPDWHCSADLCAYLQYPRSLAGATEALYNEVVSKQVRDEMDGVRWADVQDKQRVLDYALSDGRNCLRLWKDHSSKWPDREQHLSQHTTRMGHRGIGLDLPLLASGIETLRQQLHEIRKSIPWEGKPTSPKELAAECRRIGIEPPITTSVKDSRFDAWLRENEEKAPFVRGISLYRSTNRLLNGLETMDRSRDGDRLRIPLRYCGAPHTGRWSGKASDRDDDTAFNLQNLLKRDLFGVNQRHILVPRSGYSFVTLDLSQIEPRVLSWLSKNQKMLDFFRAGYDAYEAAARATKGYADPRPLKQVDPALRQRCKIETLGLGYRMGWSRLKGQAEGFGMKLVEAEARRIVDEYRAQNQGVVDLWKRFDVLVESVGEMVRLGKTGEEVEIRVKLPSGRTVRYWEPRWNPTKGENGKPRGWEVRFGLGGSYYKVHGGVLVENVTQAVAREVFADKILDIEKAGIEIVHHAHDELTAEVPDDRAEEALETMTRIMATTPDWIPGLPLASDGFIAKRYEKD